MKIKSSLAGMVTALLGCGAVALLGFYLLLQTPNPDPAPPPPPAAPHGEAGAMEGQVAALAARLQENPGDGDGWAMLGRSYAALGRFTEAVGAFSRAAGLLPKNPDVLVDYADALAAGSKGDLKGEPERLLKQALKLDPRHVKGLALAGTAAFNRGDYKSALGHWKRGLDAAPADSGFVPTLNAGIADAEARLGKPATLGKATVLGGRVTLDPSLRDKVGPDDAVFVMVRAADGGRMPLAALRTTVGALPADFAFDDEASMTPGRRLSDQPRLVVVARVSKSGEATPRPGDFEGQGESVAPGTANLNITIGRALP